MLISNSIIGHRGAAAYAPENTMSSFDKALTLGCNWIEFDVMLSADGEAFIFHDDTLKRTTNGRGQFGLVNADYVQSLDAGSWFSRQFKGEKIPSFREVIQWLVFTDINANVEIKPYPRTTEQTTVAVLSCINQFWPANKALPLVSSFDHDALTLCRTLSPELPLGLLLDSWDDNWQKKAAELQCYSIHLNKRILTAKRVQAIKAAGYQLYAYTVNRRRQARKLLDWGVDAVFSDYPDLLS